MPVASVSTTLPGIIVTDTVPNQGVNAVVIGRDAVATSTPILADDPEPSPPEDAKSAQAEEEEPPLSQLFRIAPSGARIHREVRVHPFNFVVLSASSCTDSMNCMVFLFFDSRPSLHMCSRLLHTVLTAWKRPQTERANPKRGLRQRLQKIVLRAEESVSVPGGAMWNDHLV